MFSWVSRMHTGVSLRRPKLLNGPYLESGRQVLWEDGERILCREWRRSDDDSPRAVLTVLISAYDPSRSSLDRLTREYELRDELDGAWAAQPLELLQDGGRAVNRDRVQVQQVVLNLILNAVEAMSAVDEGVRELLLSTEQSETYGVLVAVRDSGPGTLIRNVASAFSTLHRRPWRPAVGGRE